MIKLLLLLSIPIVGFGQALDTQWYAWNLPQNIVCSRPSNLSVSGGMLISTMKHETKSCSWSTGGFFTGDYTASFYQWNTFSFTYGNIAYRAAFPTSTPFGGYAAIWLLGVTNAGTPSCQRLIKTDEPTVANCVPNPVGYTEIDLSEILFNTTSVNQQIHVNGHNDASNAGIADNTAFHNYEVVWAPGHLTWYIDGVVTSSITQSYVPSVPMFLNLQTAVWNGTTPVPAAYPSSMSVDYVRVCPTTTTPGNCTAANATIFDEEFNGSGAQSDMYVAQTFQGLATGLDCANAFGLTNGVSVASSNDADYWTSGMIGPGTTIHLCGTITTEPAVLGDGAPGNPITFKLESGATIPYKIPPNGHSNIAFNPASIGATGGSFYGGASLYGGPVSLQ